MDKEEVQRRIGIYEYAIKVLDEKKMPKSHPDYAELCNCIELFTEKIKELQELLQ